MHRFVWAVVPLAIVAMVAGVDAKKKPVYRDATPIIFVHGGSGSGAQFATQAMRFASNGYDPDVLTVVEYNSAALSPANSADAAFVYGKIDARIAELQAATGHAKVDLMGHSLGTSFSHGYLSDPGRAAKIAHYVNIDGRTASAPPGGVPTLALWAGAVNRPTPPQIVGATNVTIPNQEHVEVATSKESFREMFRFLTGEEPTSRTIVPTGGTIELSGRAVIFPDNVGADGATLEIWRVLPRTGQRYGSKPRASFVLGADGAFSFTGRQRRNYEFVVTLPGQLPLHYFLERFPRSDHLIRINAAPALEPFFSRSAERTGLSVIRYKEYWGDRGSENDVLSVDDVDVINPITAPSGAVGTASVAMFLHDVGLDSVTNLQTIPVPFGPLPFLTGADFFIPVGRETLPIVTVPRGNAAATRTLNIRRIPSDEGRIAVQLHDYEE
ncbi:MAG TPA: alpha/beta hydrolase [Candidatus Binatia bacterium]|nr:alpha/beta hydrolase [Candidatus Binatia bacterium]